MEELENNLPEDIAPIPTEEIPVPPTVYQEPAAEPVQTSPYANSPYITDYNGQVPPTPTPKKKKKKKGSFFSDFKFVVAFFIIIGLVITSGVLSALFMNRYWQTKFDEINAQHEQQVEDLELQIQSGGSGYGVSTPTGSLTPSQVYAQNVSAVVSISCQVTTASYWGIATGESSGSGFFISSDGYVLTNAHVVEGAKSISVITHSENSYTATLVGSDSLNDVALLKIEATDLPFVTLGSSGALAVGDQVAAIGNPLGMLSSTMTVGYVSAKDRMVSTDGSYHNMIQTDAAINSGNSGGPLFNMEGQVVGITTAKYSGKTSSGATIEGIGFAIPVDDIQGILSQLKLQGYVSSPYLGVSIVDVSEEAQRYGLPAGAAITEVMDGYAAQEAGLQPNDIIVKLGDHKVGSVNDLTLALRKLEAGQSTTIVVFRSGSEITLNITLAEKPHQ